jgi:hypothetical protein
MYELISSLHPVAQIFITAGALLFLTSLFIALWKFAGRASRIKLPGGIEIDSDETPRVPSSSEEQNELIRDLENMLTILFRDSCQIVRHHMHISLGIPKPYLENNGDFILASNLLWRGIFGKNGKHSVRTILEDRIIHRDYKLGGEEDSARRIIKRRAFMKGVTGQIESEIQALFNREYQNIYNLSTAENPTEPITTNRALIREDLADLISEFISGDLSSTIEALFFGE